MRGRNKNFKYQMLWSEDMTNTKFVYFAASSVAIFLAAKHDPRTRFFHRVKNMF
jgi:hypothetical protein